MPVTTRNLPLEKTLKLLQDSPGYLSGQEIAHTLNISRSAVWKQIVRLRNDGFCIEARSGAGYRLLQLPDRLLPYAVAAGLETACMGRQIYYYSKTGSTNQEAKALALEGAAEGGIVIAEEQILGRGRLNRDWLSPGYQNILMSIIFRPQIQPRDAFALTMLSSLGVVKAIEKHVGLRPAIKWPNDVYLGGCKTGGILTEFSAEQDRVNYAVVGIGLNVNFDPTAYEQIQQPVTSLSKVLGKKISRVALMRELLKEIDRLYVDFKQGGFQEIFNDWIGHSMVLGKAVQVILPDKVEKGVVDAIRQDGCLLLRSEDGSQKLIFSGDVSLRV